MNSTKKNTELIKAEAKRLGFFACGISKSRFLEEEAKHLENWLKSGMNGTMSYMENYFDKRLDPTKLVPGSKSVISLLLPYYPKKLQKHKGAPVISKYAYGEDYHFVLKDKMKDLMIFIRQKIGKISGRAFTDSAPVMDKKWAELSGIAWRGKHSNMLTKHGSFFFIGELIIDVELEYDKPMNSYCGTCTLCIDACPTNAIEEPYVVNANKCISYLTIEFKENLPEELKNKFNNRVFGCDICQDVCPHNRKPLFHNEERFIPHPNLLEMTKTEWHEITEDVFRKIFKKSAVKRTKFKGFKRNLDFVKQ
ncbi:MAG: tRNA epoxyqueuosine(34) reductase QueG [Bacteroidales bacterium]|nr:tRNA epoxyqueuosine(34) reductase QueG [Bacteroidales bacterium]